MPRVIFGALMGAIAWNVITWCSASRRRSSHALIGGLVGAGIAKAGCRPIVWSGVIKTVARHRRLAADRLPAGAAAGADRLLDVRARHALRGRHARSAALQFVSASLYSLGHGGNDAQKTMGIIAVLLYSQGMLGSEFYVPFWVVITCQAAMGLGTLFGGWRIVKTMGSKITQLTPMQGFCAETGGAITLFAATWSRHSGLDHAHHHRRDHRRRRGAQGLGGALGRRQEHRRAPGSSRSRPPAAIAAVTYWIVRLLGG